MEQATTSELILLFIALNAILWGPFICLAISYPEDFKDTLQKEIEKFKSLFNKKNKNINF